MDCEIQCVGCGWVGYYSELLCSEEDWSFDIEVKDTKFNRCPDCDSLEYIEEIEETD